MTAQGFGAADKVSKSGDSMSGTLTAGGSPPFIVPGGTAGYVLTSDAAGNIRLSPAAGSSGAAYTIVTKTGNYSSAAGELVACDATSASFTVTLPNAPATGSIGGAKMVATASGHTITLATQGSDVFNAAGGSTTLTLSLLDQGVLLQYAAGIWYVIADDLPLSQLDGRYVQVAGDLGGTTSAPTVAKIQGTAIGSPPGGTTQFLRGDGTWQVPAGGGGASLDTNAAHIQALAATAAAGGTYSLAAASDHTHPNTGVALLAGASFTGNVSTSGNLSASGTFGVTGNATAGGTLAVSKALTAGVVALSYATTITVNAALGNHFRVTLTGNATLAAPSNPTDGQKIVFEIIQDLTGSRTLAYAGGTGGYAFGATVPQPTLTTTASKRDFLGFCFNSTTAAWYCLATSLGY